MVTRSHWLTSRQSLEDIREQWVELLARSAANNIFLTPDWVLTWLECNSTARITAIATFKDERLIGLALFYLCDLRLFGFLTLRCLRILGDRDSSAEYQDLIMDPNESEAALDQFASTLSAHRDMFSCFWIPYTSIATGATARFESLFRRLKLNCKQRFFDYYCTKLPRNKALFDASLSSKQRNNIKRYTRQLSDSKSLRLCNLADRSSADTAYQTLTRLHDQRWNAKGQSGAFKRKPQFATFLLAYARKLAESGQLAALCLFSDDEPIAIRFGFIHEKVLYEIQAGFIPSRNGAGLVNIDLAIDFAIRHGLENYDFLANGGEYKHRFKAESSRGVRLFAVSGSFPHQLVNQLGIWPTGRFFSWAS